MKRSLEGGWAVQVKWLQRGWSTQLGRKTRIGQEGESEGFQGGDNGAAHWDDEGGAMLGGEDLL